MQIYIELFKHRTFILLFFVFDDSRLRVFQSASTDADIRTDRRRHPHRPTRMLVSTDADGLWRTFDVQKTALYD